MYTISQTYGRRRHRQKDLHLKFRWWSSVQTQKDRGEQHSSLMQGKKTMQAKDRHGWWLSIFEKTKHCVLNTQIQQYLCLKGNELSAPGASLITSDEGWVGESSFPNDESSCSLLPGSSSILNGRDNSCAQMVFSGSFVVHVLSSPCR